MKRIAFIIAAVVGLLVPLKAEVIYNADLVNDTCISIDTNYDLDTRGMNDLAFVASYSTTSPVAKTFTDGVKSTGSITIVSFTALAQNAATFQLTVASASTAVSLAKIVVNGEQFQEGTNGQWLKNSSTATTATNIATALNASSQIDCAAANNVVYCTATVVGYYPNSWSVTSSTVAITATSVSGGRPNATLVIKDQMLVQGTHFTAATSTTATASSICAAIKGNSSLTPYVTCSTAAAPGGYVVLTASNVGTDVNSYTTLSSTPAAMTITAFTGGTDSKVNLSSDLISIDGHGYGTGLAVLYSTAGSNSIGGLTNQTTYYAYKVNTGQIKLSTSKANASAGTVINLTSNPGSQTYTLTPVGMAATTGFGFKWQAGNDGSTFVDLAVSSVTINSGVAAGTASWDFGTPSYRYYRLKYSAPTNGGSTIQCTGTGSN